jgi:hypothetical protein
VTPSRRRGISQLSNDPQDDFAAIAKPLPTGKGAKAPTESDDFSAIAHPAELTEQTGTEGMYEMSAPHGGKIKIPYSKIGDAAKSGYKMTDADRTRYLTDAAADKSLSDGKNLPEGVQVIGKNSAGQDIVAPKGVLEGGAAGRFGGSASSPFVDTVKGVGSAFKEPTTVTEWAESLIGGPAWRMILDPQVQQAKASYESAKDALKTGKKTDISQVVGHAAAAVTPLVGPWSAQVGEKAGGQIGRGDYAGAAGTIVGNAALYEAPHVVGKIAGGVVEGVRGKAKELTGTSPRELKVLAKETHEKNIKATQEHLDASQTAAEATRSKEMAHDATEKEASEKAYDKHKENIIKVNEKNKEVRESHAKDKNAADEHNEKIKAKYQETAQRLKEENSAAEHALELRRNTEANLQKDTDQYYKKEDRVKEEVRKKANDAWKPWHDKMDNVLVPETELSEPIKKVTDVSPDARRALKQLIPDREDLEAGPTAQDAWMKQRDEMAEQKLGPGKDYRDASPMRQSEIDDEMRTKHGEMPQVSAIDLENPQGARIEQIHRARSIINRNVAKGVYEGQLHGEMMQVSKNLGEIIDRYTRENGAEGDLKAGNKATKEYHEAFGRERHVPKTGEEIRKQQANPEQFKEDDDQERLKAAAVHDPSLVKDFEAVKKQRDLLKKMETEDQLRKSLQQIPPPPAVGDLRPGFALKPEPETPVYTRRDASGNLHQLKDGNWVPAAEEGIKYQLEVEPAEPILTVKNSNGQTYGLRDGKWELVPQARPQVLHGQNPGATELDRPAEEKADLKEDRAKKIEEAADKWHKSGISRTINAVLYTIPTAAGAFFLAKFGHAGWAIAEGLSAGSILGISQNISSILEKPGVVEWISKVTPKDIKVWEQLPPEQRALFADDMKTLSQAAKDKGFPVSPAINKFIARAASTSGKPRKKKLTPKELIQQAHNNLQSGFYQSGFGGIPPNAGTRYTYTAVNGDGHAVGSNDGEKWFDTQTGTEIPQ